MRAFSSSRFIRALQNDLLAQSRRVGILTLAFTGLALVVMLINGAQHDTDPTFLELVFTVALLLGGALFTSTIWNDMHHPLARFHYLMLPFSNLERFLGRWLLTAPLFYLYVVAVMMVFEPVVNVATQLVLDTPVLPLHLNSTTCVIATLMFFGFQPLAFSGAIYFRNFSLPRTAVALLMCYIALTLVSLLALRIFYWDSFNSLFIADKPIRFGLFLMLSPEAGSVIAKVLCVSAALWALYLGWLFLNDHEVQDGL